METKSPKFLEPSQPAAMLTPLQGPLLRKRTLLVVPRDTSIGSILVRFGVRKYMVVEIVVMLLSFAEDKHLVNVVMWWKDVWKLMHYDQSPPGPFYEHFSHCYM